LVNSKFYSKLINTKHDHKDVPKQCKLKHYFWYMWIINNSKIGNEQNVVVKDITGLMVDHHVKQKAITKTNTVSEISKMLTNINWRDVQTKNVVNNVVGEQNDRM